MSEPGFGSEPLAGFLEALASSASTPGGGSAAAVAGAAGAALVAMVGRLTDGKQGYEASWERMREIVAAADEARAAFLSLADRDTAAFDAVMDAFRMPKDDDEDRVTRSEAIQRAYVDAAGVPAEVARRAVDLMAWADIAAGSGYCDQSHLIRDCLALTGGSPSALHGDRRRQMAADAVAVLSNPA